jgi:hypothetical protein
MMGQWPIMSKWNGPLSRGFVGRLGKQQQFSQAAVYLFIFTFDFVVVVKITLISLTTYECIYSKHGEEADIFSLF